MQTPSRTCNVLLGTPGGDGRDGAPPDPAGTVALSTAYGDRPGSGQECRHAACLGGGHRGRARGNLVFDAQIVALCREHGISTILTNDRDFRRFETPRVRLLGDLP